MASQNKKSSKSTKILFVLIGLVAIALIAALAFNKTEEIEVVVEEVEKRTIIATVSESGVIEPRTEVKIAPDVSGEVVDLRVKEGDEVNKGDLIVTIRPDNYQSALEQAQAALNSAQANHLQSKAGLGQAKAKYLQDSANFSRTNQLYADKVVSKLEWENSQLAYEVSKSQFESAKRTVDAAYFQTESSRASLKQASQNLEKTNIYASMDGIVTKLNVELGERVVGTLQMQGTEILRIADLSRMEVKVEVNENDIITVNIGDSAQIEVDAFPDKKFMGYVSEIAYSATVSGIGSTDQITNFEVKVEIDPKSYMGDPEITALMAKEAPVKLETIKSPFRPGMSSQVEIFTKKLEDVVAIPIQAVTVKKEEKDQSGPKVEPQEIVYLLKDGKASQVEVESGISDDRYIEIQKGLVGGEIVITGPYIVLSKQLEDEMEVVMKKEKEDKKEKD